MALIECDITKQVVEADLDSSNEKRASIQHICANCTHTWSENILEQNGPMRLVVRKMFDIYPDRVNAQDSLIVLCGPNNPTESIF